MKKATMTIHPDFRIGAISGRLFGAFLEPIGSMVNGSMYNPKHPEADEQGLRKDFYSALKEAGLPAVRLPGGNFVSGWQWKDSIGPKAERKTHLDMAWFQYIPNDVGHDEYLQWAEKAGAEAIYTVNLGTGTLQDAADCVEYTNFAGGTWWSDLRKKNGHAAPYGVKTWCLGNEMDGPWQTGQKTAYEYGRIANEASKMMKWTDGRIETVACGSSNFLMPTFGEWEYTVLNECYDNVDYISLHRYYGNPEGDTADFLASSMDLDEFIRTVASICDAVKGRKHSKKRVDLSLDEWNVWYHSNSQDQDLYERKPWGTALPLLEDVYNFEDALLVGLILITILKNADRVKIACMAQLVNVIAPIMTRPGGGAWAQTIYWPLMQASTLGRGKSLLPQISCEKSDTKNYSGVPMVDAAAVLREDGSLVVFAVNRDLKEAAELSLDLRSFGGFTKASHSVLHHYDVKAANTEAEPDKVAPKDVPADPKAESVVLPAASWNVLVFS